MNPEPLNLEPQDGRLSERIIHEYRWLNLNQPPRITWVSFAEEALAALDIKEFDMVITMPRLADMDTFALGRKIKSKMPDLPVILMTHSALTPDFIPEKFHSQGIDRVFGWSGNTDILLALIKNAEDRLNVIRDTEIAGLESYFLWRILLSTPRFYYRYFIGRSFYKLTRNRPQCRHYVALPDKERKTPAKFRNPPKI